jgi:hypothetical protein
VVRTPVAAKALSGNHAEGVVRTPVAAKSLSGNHAEGVVGF